MNIISFLSPINLSQEKERFFNSSTYHPQFQYNWDKEELNQWISKQTEYSQFVNAIQNQDNQTIKSQGENIFSTKLSKEILKIAKSITQNTPEKLQTPSMTKLTQEFNKAFNFFNLNYTVEISDQHGFNFRPAQSEKKIIVSKYLSMDFFSLSGDIKHELLHIIRYKNTIDNQIPYSKNYLPTEEGLSTYFQDYTDEHGQLSLFQHAAEYHMTEVCLKSSLRDTIDFLQSIGFSKELAWQRAIRHKFGFKDTSKPGDNMKPSMYFYWQQKIKALNDNERLRLLVGKISINELPQYPKYSGKIEKAKLMEYYNLAK